MTRTSTHLRLRSKNGSFLRWPRVLVLPLMLLGSIAMVWIHTALASVQTGRLPQGVPNPDFWWAVPHLEETHLPIILPTWLPNQGRANATFDPQTLGGMPPINLSTWTNGSQHSAAGPGYSIGVGYIGAVAVPFDNLQKFVPTAVPRGLHSEFVWSTDGRDSPPVSITVVHPTRPIRLLGTPVALGHGITAYLTVDESGGSVGNFVNVSLWSGPDIVTVQYPNLAREDAVRIAASLVRVRLPRALVLSYRTTRLTLIPLGHSHRIAGHVAFGYHYQLTHIKPTKALRVEPVPAKVPASVPLPAVPNSAIVTSLALPDQIALSDLTDRQWRHSLVAVPETVLMPSWLPSAQYMPLVAPTPIASKTADGYYLGVVSNFPYQSYMFWSYGPLANIPKLTRTRHVTIEPRLTGVVGSYPGGRELKFRVPPYHITARVFFATGGQLGLVPSHPTAFLLARARQVLDPLVVVQATTGRLSRPRGAEAVSLPWGRGWLTVNAAHVQAHLNFRWHGHLYQVTTRGLLATRPLLLKITRHLTPME